VLDVDSRTRVKKKLGILQSGLLPFIGSSLARL
jgi:hypothetical protein